MRLWLARHARPLIDSGICYGRLDAEADPQATRSCAQALAAVLPQGLSACVSGLRRARQLADALSALRPDLRFASDARLNEMDFGRWEGVPWRDIPVADIDAWTRDFARHRFGGVESVTEVLARVRGALADLRDEKEAAWITHAGVIRAVDHLARHGAGAVPLAATWPVHAPGYGAWTAIEIDLRG